jgi:type II secretory pathway pseudopilin PulG
MIHSFLIAGFLCVLIVPSAAGAGSPVAGQSAATTKSEAERAWDDLRWLMTALEAYSTDNDFCFQPVGGPRDGIVSDLSKQLEWYYANTYPHKTSPPIVDPWGREYRYVISNTRKLYALYSLGPKGKLDAIAKRFLQRLRNDDVTEDELRERRTSRNIIVGAGMFMFAPDEVLRTLKPVN